MMTIFEQDLIYKENETAIWGVTVPWVNAVQNNEILISGQKLKKCMKIA